jgi:hypothetical protein
MRRIFGEWPSHIGRDARSQAQDPLRSPSWRTLPLPALLEGVAENVALPGRPVPGYGACRSAELATAVKRMAKAVPAILPREDKGDGHARAQSVGEALGVVVGPAISTLIRKVSALRRYRPGRFVREAAMTSVGSLAGTRRCISPHVFAAVGRLSALRPMAPSMPSHKDREKDVGAEACPRS